jgi:acyl-CoA reductase-like NAD-dependent aldehyde dehydrogenase
MATTTEQHTNGAAAAEDSIVVENPATGQPITTLPACTPTQLEEMAARARRAQPA